MQLVSYRILNLSISCQKEAGASLPWKSHVFYKVAKWGVKCGFYPLLLPPLEKSCVLEGGEVESELWVLLPTSHGQVMCFTRW